MRQLLIQQYLNQVYDLCTVGERSHESAVREAFKDLVKDWALRHDLIFVPEHEIAAPSKKRRYAGGALLHELRVPVGFLATKLCRGYPQENTIFVDSTEAALTQAKTEVMRCAVDDVEGLEKLLRSFFAYARPEPISAV